MNKPANPDPASTFGSAAYGGDNWSQRDAPHRDEIGKIWAPCGIDSEWRRAEIGTGALPGRRTIAGAWTIADAAADAGRRIDLGQRARRARGDGRGLTAPSRRRGSAASIPTGSNPDQPSKANLMFCADLLAMTPQGAILARPASTVRAGEERQVARRLADARHADTRDPDRPGLLPSKAPT